MHKVTVLVLVISFTLFARDSAFGQKNDSSQKNEAHEGPWSLQQCIDYALKTNLQLRQTSLTSDVNNVNLKQSEAGILPTFNGFAAHTYNDGPTLDPYTNTLANTTVLSENMGVTGGLSLFNGLQKYNTIRQNQYAYLAGKYDIDKSKNDISLNVASDYLQILFNEELLAVAQNQLDISQKQLDRTQKLFNAGTLAKGSLLDMQATLATDELSVATTQNQLDLSNLALTQLMNLDNTAGFKLQRPEYDIPLENLLVFTSEQIFEQAVKQFPEVKSAEMKLSSAEQGVKVAQGGMSPQLSFSLTYGTGYSGLPQETFIPTGINTSSPIGVVLPLTSPPQIVYGPSYSIVNTTDGFMKQYKENFNSAYGFKLNIPLFNGLQTSSAISKAKVSRISAEVNVELARQVLKKSIQQAYADAGAALKKYAATKKAVDASQESYKYSEQKYNVGALNVFDYNLAKSKLAKAKSDHLQAKYDFLFKSKVLDFYQGKPLTL
jgi:outer membrane protein